MAVSVVYFGCYSSFQPQGPTYIKMGQMMSVRPDVLPQPALEELRILQDSVQPFSTTVAIQTIEKELGCKLEEVFDFISDEPVAAASLAQVRTLRKLAFLCLKRALISIDNSLQVYRARLRSTGEYVAVKVQRPSVLETVSKDLYVLRRAAEVYQGEEADCSLCWARCGPGA